MRSALERRHGFSLVAFLCNSNSILAAVASRIHATTDNMLIETSTSSTDLVAKELSWRSCLLPKNHKCDSCLPDSV